MKKQLLIAALVIPAAAEVASRLVYERSAMATGMEMLLGAVSPGKDSLKDPQVAEDYYARMDQENRKRFQIPGGVRFSVPVEERIEDDMQVFDINPDGAADTVILYIHGGAYVNQPTAPHFWFTNALARDLDTEILFPIYPKLPCGDWADCYDRMLPLYERIAAEDPDRDIVLMGDSAGGGLALAMAQILRGMDVKQPSRLVLMSPWVDLSMENPEMAPLEKVDPMLGIVDLAEVAKVWANGLDLKDPRLSPLYGNMAGLPPIDLFVGTREIFLPEILRLDEALNAAGVEHSLTVGDSMNHCFPLYPVPEGWKARKEIEDLLR